MKRIALSVVVILSTVLVCAQNQTPEILSVSSVVAGAQKTETLFAHAMGKWSDADDHLAVWSTEIHCYRSFGFCEEAVATYYFGEAGRRSTVSTFSAGTIRNWSPLTVPRYA
jgi:hypothetical protein